MSVNYINQKQHRWLHKLMLYMILADYVLIFMCFNGLSGVNLSGGILMTAFLILYNVLLVKIVLRFTRRNNDSYIIYPVIGCCFLLAVFIFRFFLLV